MHIALEALLDFHQKMKQTIGDPRSPNVQQEKDFRLELIREELKELEEALEANDTVKVADGLADLIYVLTGSAVTWGIDIASVFDEVHRSNMTKKPENRRADGKVLKDADFSPANIRGVLDEVAESCDAQALGEDGWWREPFTAAPNPCADPACTGNHGKPSADENYPLQETKSWELPAEMVPELHKTATVVEKSDGVPQTGIKGQLTSYGAFLFSCANCDRTLAVQAQMGSRGGQAKSGSCGCICGHQYTVDFTSNPAKVEKVSE